MHNAAFKYSSINAEYRLFEIKPHQLEDFLINRKDIEGFNITIPHKVRAKEILDSKFSSWNQLPSNPSMGQVCADWAGAINTVKRDADRIIYQNTDASGFATSLEKDLGYVSNGTNVFLLGCGGAGRAIITALVLLKVEKVYIYETNSSVVSLAEQYFSTKGQLDKKLKFIQQENIEDVIKKCKLLVNATPLGMKDGDPSPIDKNLLHKDLFIYDVVYNRDTELIKNAKALGLKGVGGMGMLLYQGAAAFEIWTGKHAPLDPMRKALRKALTK
jgi:shikimate dehydrogenase